MMRSILPVLVLALAAGGCDLPAGGMQPEPGQQVRVNEALAIALQLAQGHMGGCSTLRRRPELRLEGAAGGSGKQHNCDQG